MTQLNPEEWIGLLRTAWVGHGTLYYSEQMDSTNRFLKQKAAEGAPSGSIAVCDEQTAGRGRLQRSWISEKGTMLPLSLLFASKVSPQQTPLYTFCAAMAAVMAVRELCPGLQPRIKWPNDIILNGKKLCGILCETVYFPDRRLGIVCGIGINVGQMAFPNELSCRAVSLRISLNGAEPPTLGKCAAVFLNHMENEIALLEREEPRTFLERYRSFCLTLGKKVRVLEGDAQWLGIAIGISEDGSLLVKDEKGRMRTVSCGDVSIRGIADYYG